MAKKKSQPGRLLRSDHAPLRPAPLALALTPAQRFQRLADALFGNGLPIIGVLFLHYDAPRMALVYFFDTWITLMVVVALQALLTQRRTTDGAGNGRSALANYFDAIGSSFLVVSLLMVPVMAPLLIFVGFSEGRALLASDSTLWPLISANVVIAVISFFVQSYTMPVTAASEERLKFRFQLTFFRWFAIVILFYLLGQFFELGKLFTYLMVIAYCAFTIGAECFPEQIGKIPRFLQTGSWDRAPR